MTNKFKVGDRVKCIDVTNASMLTLDEVYTVLEPRYEGYLTMRLTTCTYLSEYKSHRFELVTGVGEYTRDDVEKAMDVFDHYAVHRGYPTSASRNYSKLEGAVIAWYTRDALLEELFPSSDSIELKRLEEQARKIADDIKALINKPS